jgi:hypothetical protein
MKFGVEGCHLFFIYLFTPSFIYLNRNLYWIFIIDQKMKKNIVITGGNSGIGLETARGLYRDGHNVIIGSRN